MQPNLRTPHWLGPWAIRGAFKLAVKLLDVNSGPVAGGQVSYRHADDLNPIFPLVEIARSRAHPRDDSGDLSRLSLILTSASRAALAN
jgi:hypothetical protein